MSNEIPLKSADLSMDEAGCLLYLETCAVDHDGFAESIRMNAADHAACKRFADAGLLVFRRVPAELLRQFRSRQVTHYVVFSAQGWQLAHELRIARAVRGNESRKRRVCSEAHGVPFTDQAMTTAA